MDVQIKIFMSKVLLVLALCPVFRIKSSVFNIEELQNSKYGMEITGEPVLLNQDTDETVMQITSKHGQQYQCVLPVLHVENEEKNSKNITREEINDLLEPFNSTCLFLLNNWWTYKVCFGRSVYQYHEEGDKVTDNSSLGYYAGDTDWSQVTLAEKNTGSQKRYHSQFYSNGTLCDLTGELRKAEVKFFCDPEGSDYIARIDESSTCTYIITVYTNKLCNHSLFRPVESPKKQRITCSPALKEEQFKKYTEEKRKPEEDVSNDDFLSKKSKGNEDEDEEKMNEKPQKRTPSIFEALAKLFYKGEKEKNTQIGINGESKTGEEEKIDWKDVLKTSRDAIDKSVERLRKLQFHKKFEDETDETEDGTDAETKSRIKQHLRKGRKAVSNNYLYNKEKETASKENKYHNLIEGLKIQYRFFRKQIDIVTNDLHEKLEKLENDADGVNPVVTKMVERIKASIRRFEENQRTLDEQMKRLSTLSEAVMNDPNDPKAKEDIVAIKSRLTKLMEAMMPKTNSDNGKDTNERLVNRKEDIEKDFESQNSVKESKRKDGFFDMESPKLNRVVSKLKKIMTHDGVDEDFESEKQPDGDMYDDGRISVRVTKIKDEVDGEMDESLYNDEKQVDEINENKEMNAATKKMENIVRKQLQEAGIKHEGKVKVKIITSKDALKRVAGGHDGFQILTPQETNEFRNLLSNLLGGNQEFQKEKERQEELEDNYNLVWDHGGFASAKKESSNEHEDSDETI